MTVPKKILLEHELPANLAEIEKLAIVIEKTLGNYPEHIFAINLCVDELITNTITHGLKFSSDKKINIQISATQDFLEVLIKDEAPQFDPFTQAPEPDLTSSVENRKIGGLGVFLTKKFFGGHTIDILHAFIHIRLVVRSKTLLPHITGLHGASTRGMG